MATKSMPVNGSTRSRSLTTTAPPRRRAEQQRAQSTRTAILEAALAEFAEKGFEAASIDESRERTGFQHPLITYHYPSKDQLWQAVARTRSSASAGNGMPASPSNASYRRWSTSVRSTGPCFVIPSSSLSFTASCGRSPPRTTRDCSGQRTHVLKPSSTG